MGRVAAQGLASLCLGVVLAARSRAVRATSYTAASYTAASYTAVLSVSTRPTWKGPGYARKMTPPCAPLKFCFGVEVGVMGGGGSDPPLAICCARRV